MRIVCTLLMASLLAAVGGCAAGGAVAYAVMGPPAVKPKYVPRQEPMLVLVENYRNPSMAQIDSEQMSALLHEQLTAHEVAPLVDRAKLQALRAQKGEALRHMTIPAIGRALDAQQVLYVDVRDSSMQHGAGDVVQARIDVRVKIVDARTGATRWPKDMADGYPITGEIPFMNQREGVNPYEVRSRLLEAAAVNIGRLFYEWKPEKTEG